MLPWNDAVVEKIRSLAVSPADGDKLIEHLKKTTLVISLGLRDDYLLVAIGPSTEVLAKLGHGATLRSLPELAAVGKFADKRICSVGYSSKAFNQQCGQTKARVDELLRAANTLLPALPAQGKLRNELAKDAVDLAEDVKKFDARGGRHRVDQFPDGQRLRGL